MMNVRTISIKCSLIFLALAVFTILCVGGEVVSAVNCDASLSTAPACTVPANTVLQLNSSITYNIASLANNQVIRITGSNVTLDCNGSILIGDRTSASRGIGSDTGYTNITIKNCYVKDYGIGIRVGGSHTNVLIKNNTINSTVNQAIYLATINNTILDGNYFNNNIYSIYLDATRLINITNNIFRNSTDYAIDVPNSGMFHSFINNTFYTNGILTTNTNYSVISNNNFLFRTDNQRYSVYMQNGFFNNLTQNLLRDGNGLNHNFQLVKENGINIYNNIFTNTSSNETIGSSFSLQISGGSSNVNIYDNNFTQQDIGIRILNTTNINIYRNIINGSYTGRDGYGNGIVIDGNSFNTKQVFIYNNTFDRISSNALIFHGTNNLTFYNNNINMLNDTELLTYTIRIGNEPRCAIFAAELYKTWLGDNTEAAANNLTNKITYYKSSNVTIYNNVFNSNTQCYARFQGTEAYSLDITDFWFQSLQAPTYYVDRDDFFLSNSFNEITTKNASSSITNILSQGWMGSSGKTLNTNYILSKSYLYIANINDSVNYTYNIYNRSSALITLSNGTGFMCTGNCNLTLDSNNYSYVFDDFNVTEGINRLDSPISMTTTNTDTKKTWHIASLIDNEITTSAYLNSPVDCSLIGSLVAKPKSSSQYTPTYTCSNGIISISDLKLDYSTSSNEIILNYSACDNTSKAGYNLIMIVASIIIIGVYGMFIYNRGLEGFNLKDFILMFAVLMVVITLWSAAGQNMGSICGVVGN